MTPQITEVKDRIYAVTIPDNYERAMTFCRVQEFYESPNPDFRGKNFNIWDYIEWYSRQNDGSFTYTSDWSGFNIPLVVAWECYEGVASMKDTWKSKWDETMKDIVWAVQGRMFHKKNKRDSNAYIIGTEDMEGDTFKHEVCHGLYYTNKEYKKAVDEITDSIDPEVRETLKNNLLEMGYTEGVVYDEIQAYLNFGWESNKFSKGVKKNVLKGLNKKYLQLFELVN
jgi:hypothetical protein